jgi:hypothetical protein
MTDTTTAKTFDLDYPVNFQGETIKSLTLRRPKGREIRAMQSGKGSNIERSFEMMGSLAERPSDLFDEMDAADIRKIDGWLNEILGE